ncbi:MAG: hypothetical protein ABJA71_11385 [Ginsengibacter sp.]
MSNVTTTSNKEKSKIFETVLSSPGMSEKCKIILTLSRQNIIIFARLIEAGLLTDENGFDDEIIGALPKECIDEMRTVHEEILRKAELAEFYERLKML